MNHLLKKARAAFCVLVLLMAFSNCEKETLHEDKDSTIITAKETHHHDNGITLLKLKDLPKSMGLIDKINGLVNKGSLSKNINGLEIEEEDIIELENNQGKKSYTLRIKDADPNNIYF